MLCGGDVSAARAAGGQDQVRRTVVAAQDGARRGHGLTPQSNSTPAVAASGPIRAGGTGRQCFASHPSRRVGSPRHPPPRWSAPPPRGRSRPTPAAAAQTRASRPRPTAGAAWPTAPGRSRDTRRAARRAPRCQQERVRAVGAVLNGQGDFGGRRLRKREHLALIGAEPVRAVDEPDVPGRSAHTDTGADDGAPRRRSPARLPAEARLRTVILGARAAARCANPENQRLHLLRIS